MKKIFVNTAVVMAVVAGLVSCKNEKKNETTPKEAEEVTEKTVESATYTINAEESVIEWRGEKPTGEHYGTINIKEGAINAKGEMIEGGRVVIDMNSITVEDLEGEEKENLEAHLKGAEEESQEDFFYVSKYPESVFEITGVEEKEGKTWLNGNLTMRGITKNINLPVAASFSGDQMKLTSETFTIDRTKWDVNYGSKSVFEGLKDKFINDDIELKIAVKAAK